MNRNDSEFDVYHIPPNFIEGGTVMGCITPPSTRFSLICKEIFGILHNQLHNCIFVTITTKGANKFSPLWVILTVAKKGGLCYNVIMHIHAKYSLFIKEKTS